MTTVMARDPQPDLSWFILAVAVGAWMATTRSDRVAGIEHAIASLGEQGLASMVARRDAQEFLAAMADLSHDITAVPEA